MSSSAADRAYAEAVRRCQAAEASGASELAFDFPLGPWLEELPPELGRLTALQSLDLSGCKQIRDLVEVAGLTSLQSLNLSDCNRIRDLEPVAGLTSLQSLNLFDCTQISDLGAVAGLTSLISLNLTLCKQIRDLEAVTGLTSLQSLDLSWCQQISDLEALAGLVSLQSLDLSGCMQIRNLAPLTKLTSLQSLDLSGCEQISDLEALAGLTSLQSLNLSYCQQISLEPLAGLVSLQSLNLSWCTQISDFEPLAGLTSLQSLNLSFCGRIRALETVAGLISLQSLNLTGWQIWDVEAVAGLTSLQSLSLSGCMQIRNLAPLTKLTSLQSLDLSGCEQINNLESLAGLTSLQSLNLSYCQQISLEPLAELVSLQSLNLSNCTQIRNFEPLANLASLQSLNLSFCGRIRALETVAGLISLQSLNLTGWQIWDVEAVAGLTSLQSLSLSGCTISDLEAVAGLTSLRSLNLSGCTQISDFEPLAGLTSLRSLNLSGCTISDLEAVAGLTSLQSLDLSGCTQISDFEPLAGLTSLRSLNLSGCRSTAGFGPLETLLPGLRELHLYSGQFPDLPTEICGAAGENVLENVRAHYQDLRAGAALDAEVKVLVLGNGGAGKTQLCRRLRGLAYVPLPSTHGIELGEMRLELENSVTPVRLSLWDFGGQEIYHGSHALFLQGHAVYLILWTPILEGNTAPYEENGLVLRHRPLAYWLDYVRAFAGTDSPLIVVQSQCDTPDKRVRGLPAGASDADFSFVQQVRVSAKTDLGLDSVRVALKEGVRDLLFRRPLPPIGAGRVRVRQRLREMLERDRERPTTERQRWLERAEFDRICEEERGISSTEALLDFLHHGGVVFYRPGLFGGRVVLDQNWALEAIYSVFDRRKSLSLLRNYGRFSRSDLEFLVWQKFERKEQEVFLGMMRSCRICFQVRRARAGGEEAEYIAPELLPRWQEAHDRLLAGRLLSTAPDSEAQAGFGFLHEGVLRGYLSAVGEQAGDAAIYWKYGCWFYEKTTDSRVLIESRWENAAAETGPGVIHFRAWGQRARALLEPLVEALDQIAGQQRPTVRWIEDDGASSSRQARISMASGPGDLHDAGGGLSRLQIVEAIQPAAGRPAIYVSYAWGDKDSEVGRQRAQVVDGLCAVCEEEGWQVFRDKTAMRYGDRISDFMKSISRADLILVVISEKYLRSEYCMAELHGIYQRSLGEKDEFLERVMPFTLEDAKIGTVWDRVAHAEYWKAQVEKIKPCFESIGSRDFQLYKAMMNWHNDVGDILAFINDVLHPDGFEAIVANEYQGLRTMLKARK